MRSVTAVAVRPRRTTADTLTDETTHRRVAGPSIYRSDEDELQIVEAWLPRTFDGGGLSRGSGEWFMGASRVW